MSEKHDLMLKNNETTNNWLSNGEGIDSRFRLIVVAALRSKQLLRGSQPRIEVDPLRRRNTTIAVEEVKRGLVPFRVSAVDQSSSEQPPDRIEKVGDNGPSALYVKH